MIKLLDQTRRPDVSFSRNGKIRITARVARALSLRPGDVVNIVVNNGEYLLYATHIDNNFGRHEAQCYPTKKGSGNYCANSVRLCRSLFASVGINANNVAYMTGKPVERNGIIYVPIITLNPQL